ncbi:unnamed protein product [Spirodela intermedia]|uniref:Uncharacterized protein n=1 Tax=Spirodela intermedia TaxID=51605 RepID=A0A7I8KVJ6_SPIIN|nr:unnamed protein product [Spirodela intermedia]
MEKVKPVTTPLATHFKLSSLILQIAIHLSKDQLFHERTKNIDVHYHFVQDVFLKGDISIMKISMHDNPADMMIKPLLLGNFQYCLNLTGLFAE